MIGFNTNINIPEWFCLFACEELCSKVHCYWYLCHLINDDIINPCIGDWCSLVILISMFQLHDHIQLLACIVPPTQTAIKSLRVCIHACFTEHKAKCIGMDLGNVLFPCSVLLQSILYILQTQLKLPLIL